MEAMSIVVLGIVVGDADGRLGDIDTGCDVTGGP